MSAEPTTVLITGGTSGIGRATAQLFSRRGATVIVTGRDEVRGKDVAAYLASEDARPITGAVLAVDAGRVATL